LSQLLGQLGRYFEQMKQSILILAFTAIAAIAALIIGRSLGTREDVSCAFGGLIGFALSNIFCGHKPRQIEPSDASAIRNATKASIIAYFVFWISCFAFIGWLTGYLHHHGANAGGITGSLGGAILAIVTPQFRGTSIIPLRKELMIGLVLLLTTMFALVVWAMYFTEMKYWAELSMLENQRALRPACF
jgi:hypothetical protein